MRIISICVLCVAGLILVQACSNSSDQDATIISDDAEHAEIVKRDLFAIISLQGVPCQRVVSYAVQDELDYVATCESGDRYRVHVSVEGQVHVNAHAGKESSSTRRSIACSAMCKVDPVPQISCPMMNGNLGIPGVRKTGSQDSTATSPAHGCSHLLTAQ